MKLIEAKKKESVRVILTDGSFEIRSVQDKLLRLINKIGLEYSWTVGTMFVYLPFGDVVLKIFILSCVGEYWKKIPVEVGEVNEILFTKLAMKRLKASPDGVSALINYPVVPVKDLGNLGLYFLQMVMRDTNVSPLPGKETDKPLSVSEKFNFPLSMYRAGMHEYFSDPLNPNQEEFLFALMMENVSARTEEEKKAFEDATLYVKGISKDPN